MGVFSKKTSNVMQQRASQDAEAAYRRHKGEIESFLSSLSAQDKAYFNDCLDELLSLTLPYEGAISYPNVLVTELQRIGNGLRDRFGGNMALQYALYVYAPKAPMFSGQVEMAWFPGRGCHISI